MVALLSVLYISVDQKVLSLQLYCMMQAGTFKQLSSGKKHLFAGYKMAMKLRIEENAVGVVIYLHRLPKDPRN